GVHRLGNRAESLAAPASLMIEPGQKAEIVGQAESGYGVAQVLNTAEYRSDPLLEIALLGRHPAEQDGGPGAVVGELVLGADSHGRIGVIADFGRFPSKLMEHRRIDERHGETERMVELSRDPDRLLTDAQSPIRIAEMPVDMGCKGAFDDLHVDATRESPGGIAHDLDL